MTEKIEMSRENKYLAVNMLSKCLDETITIEMKELVDTFNRNQNRLNIVRARIDAYDKSALEQIQDDMYVEEMRFCDVCHKPITEGYEGGGVWCSLECLGMTEKEVEEQYSDEDDCVYFTQWD